MFGLGWSEMVLIGIVALIIIGPKDLPGMFKAMGEFTGKARGMAREFSRAMEQAANESGVNEVSNTLRAAANPQQFGVNKIRDAVGASSGAKGPETSKLSAERQEAKDRMAEQSAKIVKDRQAREAAAAEDAKAETPAPAKPVKKAKAESKPAAKPKSKAAKPKASKPEGDA